MEKRKRRAATRGSDWTLAHFISRRLAAGGASSHRLSAPYLRIATIAVAISVVAMLVAVSVARGFQQAVSSRATAFVGHIQVLHLDGNESYEQTPIARDATFEEELLALKGLVALQRFALKPAIIKAEEAMHGCILKGCDESVDWRFLEPFLVRGELPDFSSESGSNAVAISEAMATKLHLDTGQQLTVYFVQDPPRVRRLRVAAVFNTQLTEFDDRFIYGHMRHIQRLNGWDSSQIGGYELHLKSLDNIDGALSMVHESTARLLGREEVLLKVVDVRQRYSAIFDWLGLLDLNVVVLLVLMLAVAGVNMITALLILILERTQMIGLLKALGARNGQIRKIFLLQSARILGWGLLIGNGLGLALLAVQQHWQFAKLNPADYYIDHVPVLLAPGVILAINIATALITLLLLLLPSAIIARVNAGVSVRFE